MGVTIIYPFSDHFECAHCDRKYLQHSSLKKHLTDTHGIIVTFTCRLCGFQDKTLDSVKSHYDFRHRSKKSSKQSVYSNKRKPVTTSKAAEVSSGVRKTSIPIDVSRRNFPERSTSNEAPVVPLLLPVASRGPGNLLTKSSKLISPIKSQLTNRGLGVCSKLTPNRSKVDTKSTVRMSPSKTMASSTDTQNIVNQKITRVTTAREICKLQSSAKNGKISADIKASSISISKRQGSSLKTVEVLQRTSPTKSRPIENVPETTIPKPSTPIATEEMSTQFKRATSLVQSISTETTSSVNSEGGSEETRSPITEGCPCIKKYSNAVKNLGKVSCAGKGSGAGFEYEEEMAGLLALRLCTESNVINFKIWMNHPQVPALDDVIFAYRMSSGETTTVYIQLKHKDSNGKKIQKTALEREKDDYSLYKYLEAYKIIKSKTTICNEIDRSREIFVIFTNAMINPAECQNLEVHSEEKKSPIYVRVEEQSDELSHYQRIIFSENTKEKFEGKIYRFVVTSEGGSEEELNYFKNLFLFVNQSNVGQLRHTITKNCMEHLLGDQCDKTKLDDTVTKYREYIKHRKDSTVKKPFTKDEILCKVTWLYTKSLHVAPKNIVDFNKDARLWNEATVEKRLVVVSEHNTSYVDFLQHCLEEDSTQKYLRLNLKHLTLKLIQKYLPISWKSESLSQYQTLLLESEQNVDEGEKELLEEIVKVLIDRSNFKLIMIFNLKQNIFEYIADVPILFGLKDLEDGNVLMKMSLTYYGVSVTVEELLNKHKGIEKCFQTHHILILLLFGLKIGFACDKNLDFFIERKLTVTAVKSQIFNCTDLKSNVICLCGNFQRINFHNFSYIESTKVTDPASLKNYHIIKLNSEMSGLNEFRCLKDKLYGLNLLLIHIKEESNRTILELIGSSVNSEAFLREKGFLYEEVIFWDNNFDINIITGEPGMGKSVLCNHLPQTEHLVLQITQEQLEKTRRIEEIFEIHADQYIEISKEIFKYHCDKKNVLLVIDAFDELTEKTKENALEVIEQGVSNNYKILVTTRPASAEVLEKRMGVISQKLKAFGLEEQGKFFVKYWTAALKLSEEHTEKVFEFVCKLMERVEVSVNDRERSITGIPLQCRMLAEIYQEQCKEYIAEKTSKPPESTKLDVVDLYDKCIQKKINIFCSEKMELKQTAIELFKDRVIKPDTEIYQMYALLTIFSELDSVICKFNTDNGKSDYDKLHSTGLFTSLEQRTMMNKIIQLPMFVHRTYAEYFAALYLFQHWEIEKELICLLLSDRKYDTVRYFFDLLMARGCPLITATIRNDIGQITNELDVNETDKGGRTALHLATMWGIRDADMDKYGEYNGYNNIQVFKYLMQLDVSKIINRYDSVNKWTPIKYADYTRSLHAMNELISEATVSDNDISTLLNDLQEPQFYINKYTVRYGHTLLHHIAIQGLSEVLRYLINKKSNLIDLNCNNHREFTPLIVAAEKGQLDIVNVLIKAGANLNAAETRGNTALHCAAGKGHVNVVSTLITAGANVNAVERRRYTALHRAALGGHLEVVNTLIKAQADVNARNYFGYTPMYGPAGEGDKEIVDALIIAGANIHIPDNNGYTPLHRAAEYGRTDVVKTLITAGANINTAGVDGTTALHLATRKGQVDVVDVLIKAGTEIEAVDKNDKMAQHIAVIGECQPHEMNKNCKCESTLCDIVALLVQHGANLNTMDGDGNTPMQMAQHVGHDKIVQQLIKMDAAAFPIYEGDTEIKLSSKRMQ